MAKRVVVALIMCVTLAGGAWAQQAAGNSIDRDIQLLRKDLQSGRKQVVAANMLLTDTEAQNFWPIYEKYMAEMLTINDTKVAVVKSYAANFNTLTNEQAQQLVKQWGDADLATVQLREKYFPIFQKAVSGKKAARFFQIDRRVSLLIDLQAASQIPLVEP